MPIGWASGPSIRDTRPTTVRRARLQAIASGTRTPRPSKRQRR